MLQNVENAPSQDFSGGLNTISDIFKLEPNQSPNLMDVKVNFDGSIEKRLGTSTTNSVALTGSANSKFTGGIAQSISNSLAAYWKLDESIGTRKDSYGTNDLTDLNTTSFSDGRIGQAASFKASNSEGLLRLDTSSLSTGDVDITWAGWIYLHSTAERTIFAKRDYDEKTVLLLHGSGPNAGTTILDSSFRNFTVTANSGAQISTAKARFNLSSIYFNGSSSFISISQDTAWLLSGSNNRWTIEGWCGFGRTDSNGIASGIISQSDGSYLWSLFYSNSMAANSMGQLIFQAYSGASKLIDYRRTFQPDSSNLYHLAVVRDGTSLISFANGVTLGASTISTVTIDNIGSTLVIGRALVVGSGLVYHSGWIDEFRFTNGIARYSTTGNFTVPTQEFITQKEYEYWCYVNSDSIVTFRASSDGLTYTQLQANSFGAISTATWYQVVAWHDTANFLGLSVNLSVDTASFVGGLRAGSAPFTLGCLSNATYAFMDGRIDEFGVWRRVLTASERSDLYASGSGVTYSPGFDQFPWASFDFGASGTRWTTVAAGSGIYASSNLGVNFVTIRTARTGTYQYFERSKNVLVGCSDAYDDVLMWTGSANAPFVLMNNSAPQCKYAINFQGFLIMLNSRERKRGFYYEDENTQLTGDWADSFDFPSESDDEITGAVILRKKLYVSTENKLFRVTFVGGNPDWSYLEVKDFGYVSRTMKKLTVKDIGEVIVGESQDRRVRLFDGGDDKIISDDVENDNGMCDFAMQKISLSGSGLTTNFAEFDPNDQVWKLCTTIGANSLQTTHFLNYDPRAQAFYPDSNRPFNTMCVATSANRQYVLAFDRSGFCHILNSGNLDSGKVAINEHFESAFLFNKTPSQLSKSQKIDFYFDVTSSNNVYFYDRVDFSSIFNNRETFKILNNESVIQLVKSYDIPSFQNVYQYRLSSSSGTSDPWRLNRADYFSTPAGYGRNQ